MATVGEFQRQIGLLDGLLVELFDDQGQVLDADLELGVEWPYVRPAPGKWTVLEWQRERLAPLRSDLVAWVMAQGDKPAPNGRSLKKVRTYYHPAMLEQMMSAEHRFDAERESVVIIIGDRDADISGVHLGDAVVAEGPYGIAVRLTKRRQVPLTVWVHCGWDNGPPELLVRTVELPSSVLRVQDLHGTWHTDVPCAKPRVIVGGDPVGAPSVLSIGVDRDRSQERPEPVVDLDTDARYKARPRNDLEQRLSGPVWESARGTARHWQDEEKVGDAFWEVLERSRTFPAATVKRSEGSVSFSSSVSITVPLLRVEPKGKKAKKGKGKKPIRSVHHPVGHKHQTVTEQIATFLATREPFQMQTDPAGEERLGELLRPEHLAEHLDLEIVGAEVAAGRACDVVHATLRPDESGAGWRDWLAMDEGALAFRLWVDSERLVILRAVKLVDGEPAEIVEFLDIAFDD